MKQSEVFEIQLKQLQEVFRDFRETVNPRDRLRRAAEMKAYLRSLTDSAERLHDEAYRHTPQFALQRMITKYKNINPMKP
jgi:hypothetical protein